MNSGTSSPQWSERVMSFILDQFGNDICLDDLATVAELSKFNFCRQFHRHYGLPPLKWVWRFRAVLAGELLKLSIPWSIADIVYTVGFTSPAHFSRAFRDEYGVTPTQYRTIQSNQYDAAMSTEVTSKLFDPKGALLTQAYRLMARSEKLQCFASESGPAHFSADFEMRIAPRTPSCLGFSRGKI